MDGRQAPGIGAADFPTDSADRSPVAGQIEELLRTFSSTVRSYRLYAGNGPMLERFVVVLRERVRDVWEELDRLRLEITENAILWEGHRVYPTGDAGADLAFLFYKDGIRTVTLLPGLEEELDRLLSVLGRAPQLREEEDDLVTLLWEENLAGLRYELVDLPVDSIDLGAPSGAAPARIDPAAVRAAASEPAPSTGLSADDFRETLYFLDEDELRKLEHEVQLEANRDLWRDVLNALLDRLEDGSPERQLRIARILEEVLPSMLSSGAFDRAASLLDELTGIATGETPLPPEVLQRIRLVFEQLASPQTLEQLVEMMDEPARAPGADSFERLLGYFPPASLAPLTQLIDRIARPDTRRIVTAAAERLAAGNRDQVVRLLASDDPLVVRGALRWVGSLAIGSAAGEVMRLLRHDSPLVREAAVEAVVGLRAAVAGNTVIALLDDPEREVRMAAARALGALEHSAAREPLEEAIQGKRLRAADRTEKLAFFEALGRVGGAEAVPFLDRLLNGRKWLGRGEPAEIRACAAYGLARVRHPSARQSLERAADDSDPVVRTAVARALRGGTEG